jgi:hypothetical protein
VSNHRRTALDSVLVLFVALSRNRHGIAAEPHGSELKAPTGGFGRSCL